MTDSSTESITQPAPAAAPLQRRVAVLWAILIAALAAGFYLNFAEMWHRWFPLWDEYDMSLHDRLFEGQSYYTHAPLVPAVSILIAVLLVRHTRVRVRPRPVLGGVMLAGSLLLHLMASFARVNFASGFALIGVLVSLVVMIWGLQVLRRFWFVLALLLFMVPLPEIAISDVNFRLKMLASRLGVSLANGIGVMAVRNGNQVFVPDKEPLVVANVCNGLRTLISLIAFGALYAYVARLRGAWRLALFAMAIPVALLANSLRVTSLIVVANGWSTAAATEGWFHDASGLMIYVLAFLMMFGLERFVLWSRQALGRPAKVYPLFHDVRRGPEDRGQARQLARAVRGPRGYVAVGMVLLASLVSLHFQRTGSAVYDKQALHQALPTQLSVGGETLTGYRVEISRQQLAVLQTEEYICRRFHGAGQPTMDFLVVFSRDNRKGTHPPDVCLEGGGWETVHKGDLVVRDVRGIGEITCRELVTQRGGRREYHLYSYMCGGQYTPSFYQQQLMIVANGLLRRDASGALVRVSMVQTEDVPTTRSRAVGLLRAALPYVHQNVAEQTK